MNTIKEGEIKFHENQPAKPEEESKAITKPLQQLRSVTPRTIEPR
jgi:hypothetical protein